MKAILFAVTVVMLSACSGKTNLVDDTERKAQQIEYEEQKAQDAKQRLDKATQ